MYIEIKVYYNLLMYKLLDWMYLYFSKKIKKAQGSTDAELPYN